MPFWKHCRLTFFGYALLNAASYRQRKILRCFPRFCLGSRLWSRHIYAIFEIFLAVNKIVWRQHCKRLFVSCSPKFSAHSCFGGKLTTAFCADIILVLNFYSVVGKLFWPLIFELTTFILQVNNNAYLSTFLDIVKKWTLKIIFKTHFRCTFRVRSKLIADVCLLSKNNKCWLLHFRDKIALGLLK